MSQGKILDVSKINFSIPDIKRFCKNPKKPCIETYYETANKAISDAVIKLRDLIEGSNGVKGYFVNGVQINRLEDVCSNLPDTTIKIDSSPEAIAQEFAKLTACKDKMAHTIFMTLEEAAKESCIYSSLRSHGDGSASDTLWLPIGRGFKNCIKFTVPLDGGGSKLIDVHLPDGYGVSERQFIRAGSEGGLRVYRLTFYNPDQWFAGVFRATIERVGPDPSVSGEPEVKKIPIELFAIDIPAMR